MSSSKVDWREKYLELRSKYLNAVDVAFRLGMQEGLKQGQIDSMQQQLQQQQEQMAMQQQAAMAAQQGGGQPGQEQMPGDEEQSQMPPGMEGQVPEGAAQEAPAGDELDMSMNELESYLKSEKYDAKSLMKAFHKVKEAKKVNDDKRVEAVNKKVVSGILAKWDEQEQKASNKLKGLLKDK